MKKRIMILNLVFVAISFGAQAMEGEASTSSASPEMLVESVAPVALCDIDGVPDVYRRVLGQFDTKRSELQHQVSIDCHIIEILYQNASLRGLYEWPSMQLISETDGFSTIVWGVEERSLYERLLRIFGIDLERMRQEPWIFIKTGCPPELAEKKSQEKYALFLKYGVLEKEDLLINLLADKFGFCGRVCCSNKWLNTSGVCEERKCLYIWVEKEIVDDVKRKFKCSVISL